MRIKAAQFLGTYKGKRVYRFAVREVVNSSYLCRTIEESEYSVIAHTAAEAIDLIRDERGWPAECEYYAYGAKGGKTYRYTGWETSITAQLADNRRVPSKQLALDDVEISNA